ncbi:hypothetical protein ACLOJK_036948 [Asimina triloba]
MSGNMGQRGEKRLIPSLTANYSLCHEGEPSCKDGNTLKEHLFRSLVAQRSLKKCFSPSHLAGLNIHQHHVILAMLDHDHTTFPSEPRRPTLPPSCSGRTIITMRLPSPLVENERRSHYHDRINRPNISHVGEILTP